LQEDSLRYIFLFLTFFLFISCSDPDRKYVRIDHDESGISDADADSAEADDEISDADADSSTQIVSVARRRIDNEFSASGVNSLVQEAELKIDSLKVARTMNGFDTSFTMHKDDAAKVAEILGTVISDECKPCEDGSEIYLEIVTKDEQICCVTDSLKIDEADHYLMVPVHSMPWPFSPQDKPHPVGHTPANIQHYTENYSEAYFHQGVDIVKDEPVDIFNPYDGRVTEIGYYRVEEMGGESPYYFQVVIKTVNGLEFQLHHTDDSSVPQEVYDINGTDTVLKAGEKTGKIVFWPTPDSFSKKPFHHIHFNVLTEAGIKLNPLQLMVPQNDSTAPEIEEILLIDADRTETLGNDGISEKFQVVVKVKDFAENEPWPNPPRYTNIEISDTEGTSVYMHYGYDIFRMLSESEFDFACDYYLCEMSGTGYSKGDYGVREFYIVATSFDESGNMTDGISNELFEPGNYIIKAISCDESGNCGEKTMDISF